jgi:hypothetical protein
MKSATTTSFLVFALIAAGCSSSEGDSAVRSGTAETSPATTAPSTSPPIAPVSTARPTTGVTSPTIPPPTALPAPTSAAPDAPATTSAAPSITTPPPADTSPLEVAWVGGSEVELRDVSLPALADGMGLAVDDRRLAFRGITTIAASADDTHGMIVSALEAGADALIVTVNPQWLYGRVCEGVEQPHARYACLLADGEISGGPAIDGLMTTIASAGVPALLVLMPTSVDALENPELSALIALANDRLEQRIPGQPGIRVLDESLTAGRPEFREGAGFHDMVHTTPDGAQLLAAAIAGELVDLLAQT